MGDGADVVRRYTIEDPGSAKCPKCARFGFAFDKGVKAWICTFCRYRDR